MICYGNVEKRAGPNFNGAWNSDNEKPPRLSSD